MLALCKTQYTATRNEKWVYHQTVAGTTVLQCTANSMATATVASKIARFESVAMAMTCIHVIRH